MEKRPRRTPAEKARAQYTNYAVKEPMELMEFLTAKMPDASRTKLKSLLSKRVVLVDNVITTQFNFPLKPGMKVRRRIYHCGRKDARTFVRQYGTSKRAHSLYHT